MDLSRQKTFSKSDNYQNNIWMDSHKNEKFILEQFESGNCKFSFYNEMYDQTEFICLVTSLEELEIEYNKRSNNLFEWK